MELDLDFLWDWNEDQNEDTDRKMQGASVGDTQIGFGSESETGMTNEIGNETIGSGAGFRDRDVDVSCSIKNNKSMEMDKTEKNQSQVEFDGNWRGVLEQYYSVYGPYVRCIARVLSAWRRFENCFKSRSEYSFIQLTLAPHQTLKLGSLARSVANSPASSFASIVSAIDSPDQWSTSPQ